MEKVKLTKDAKVVFRLLDKGIYQCPYNMHRRDFNIGSLELQRLNFAVCHQEEGGDVVIAHLVSEGRQYIAQNPSLSNPIDWWRVINVITTILTLIVSILALFIVVPK